MCLCGAYVRHSTFRCRKKAVAGKHACHVGDRAFRGCIAPASVGPTTQRAWGRVWGDEGKAVGSVLPTALLSEPRIRLS